MPFTVLIVEDDLTPRKVARRVCEAAGWTVYEAGSVREGLALVHLADAVVLDAGLPNGLGESPVEGFRRRTNVPLLMWTGRGDEMLHAAFRRDGADDVLVKPNLGIVQALQVILQRRGGSMVAKVTHTMKALDKIDAQTVTGASAAVAAPRESFKAGAKRWLMSAALLGAGYFCALQKWPWMLAAGFGVGGFYVFSPRKTNDIATWLIAKVKDALAMKKGSDVPTTPPEGEA